MAEVRPLWPHQEFAIQAVPEAIASGHRAIVLTSPTGGGKTRIIAELVKKDLEAGRKSVLYTNRKMLLDQLSDDFNSMGIDHGIRAASREDEYVPFPFQVSSVQTEGSRTFKRRVWSLHEAQRVYIDESHVQTGATPRRLIKEHREAGAAVVGFTATPIDLGGIYDHLIVAGTPSELRRCGALVPCDYFGPDEPDIKMIGKVELGKDPTEKQNHKAMVRPVVFARVLQHYRAINRDMKPTILFGPDVAGSLWFAEQFWKAGIAAAHIDGDDVWINGQLYESDRKAREEVKQGSKSGDIKVVCNRFVLREGIDMPWLGYGILATVFGSLTTYLQSCGRLLRAFPGMDRVTIQDHGGNWWRFGSPNEDRIWDLTYTSTIAVGLRHERMRSHKEAEPLRCPNCSRIIRTLKCVCGHEIPRGRKSRPVIQANGYLKEMFGDIFRPRKISKNPKGPERWERMVFRSKTEKGERTFRAAAALFAKENNFHWPDPRWPMMPKDPLDWFLLCKDVPRERLT
jgi:superfamily II DNA or RNA helicase